MPFEIIRNDITKVKADAIVNSANPHPVVGGGTDYAIYQAAGMKELLAERKKIGDIATGQAFATPAFALQADYIIHTVGPIWQGGKQGELDHLRECYENSLNLAISLGCESIAFPLISTGVYGFPKDRALQTALDVIETFIEAYDIQVILVVFGKEAFQLSGELVDQVREYVDENYEEAAKKAEYTGAYRSVLMQEREAAPRSRAPHFRKASKREAVDMAPMLQEASIGMASLEDVAPREAVDIDKLIRDQQKTFQEKLFEIIDARGLSGPQVYRNYVSKQVFSKIQCNKNYQPTKGTALALCLSLHLGVEETQDLIGRAGFTLSPSKIEDIIIRGCIKNKEFNLVQINCILFSYDCGQVEKMK